MKLWHSFIKEITLSARSFYFYTEVIMAFVFLFLLLFVIPESFDTKGTEYLYYDIPEIAEEYVFGSLENEDEDGVVVQVEIKDGKEVFTADLYESDETKFYVFDSEETVIQLADHKKDFGGVIRMSDTGEMSYEYYLQGYESSRLKNIYRVFHNKNIDEMHEAFDAQEVRQLSSDYAVLTDRENVIPSFLTFNGSLMGLFILAAYIFLDKNEGVIKAYAMTPSPLWHYLMSKVGVVLLTSTITSLLIVMPVMGFSLNYGLLFVFLLATGFFSSAFGLLLTSFYNNFQQAFGMVYLLIIALMLPNFSYFIPGWEPAWIKVLPTYPMLEGFKEILLNGDFGYVWLTSLGFLAVGALLFFLAHRRFKKSLTV